MNVSLTPAQEKYIAAKVKSGQYQTASEVVREALRMLQGEESEERRELREVRIAVRRAISQMNRGQGVPLEEARARSRKRLDQRLAARRRKSA